MPLKILLLDFWSEKNRGDAAMQQALIRMTRQYFKSSRVYVCMAYGFNQAHKFIDHFDYTLKEGVDDLLPGFFPTFFPMKIPHSSNHRSLGIFLLANRTHAATIVKYTSLGIITVMLFPFFDIYLLLKQL